MPQSASGGNFPARSFDRYARATPPADGNAPAEAAEGLPGAGAATTASTQRKIIYVANVELVVEDFTPVVDKVSALVKKFDGFVADSSLSGTAGSSRRGTWKIRIPVANFDSFVAGTKGLGELISAGTSSDDVSEEYYDVDARIRNKTKEEERLIKLLEERPGKLEDVIAIERELSRVREEVERLEGRLRMLVDLTSLTTVTLSIQEIRGYEPAEAPTLATRINRSFGGSLDSLRILGENLLISAAALVPWLPVLAVLAGIAYWILRKLARSARNLPRRAIVQP